MGARHTPRMARVERVPSRVYPDDVDAPLPLDERLAGPAEVRRFTVGA